jgi:hypothetical protein
MGQSKDFELYSKCATEDRLAFTFILQQKLLSRKLEEHLLARDSFGNSDGDFDLMLVSRM